MFKSFKSASQESITAIKMSNLSTTDNEFSFSKLRQRFGANTTIDTESTPHGINLMRFDTKYR